MPAIIHSNHQSSLNPPSLRTLKEVKPPRIGMVRDPRASKLEPDPFDRIGNHTSKQPSVRIISPHGQGNPFEPFMRGFFDVSGPSASHHKGNFFHFSERELKDLALATFAFGFAISLVFEGGIFGMMDKNLSILLPNLINNSIFAIAALGPAFIIHELAHKYVARHYGCWAEFRADPKGLKNGILIAFLIGFVFMAPGAVMVAGRVSKKENGIIALAGPISNIILFGIGFFGGAFLIGITDSNLVTQFVGFWLWGNAILGAFNMLPFGPLDGRKVKDWSEPIFWLFLAATLSLVAFLIF